MHLLNPSFMDRINLKVKDFKILDLRRDIRFNIQALKYFPLPSQLYIYREKRKMGVLLRDQLEQKMSNIDMCTTHFHKIFT